MSLEKPELTRLQRWMQEVVVHPGTVKEAIESEGAIREIPSERLSEVVLPSHSMTSTERVGVYHGMYLMRMEQARLRPIPASRLLAFKYAVIPNLVAYHEDRPSPGPRRRATWVALYRRDYSVLRLELSRAEYDLLRAIVDGTSLGEALATAVSSKSPRQQAKIFRWFRTWVSEGLFMAIET